MIRPASQSAPSEDNIQVSQPARRVHRFDWRGSIPFLLVHLAAISVFFVTFHWSLVALCIGSMVLRMFFVTAGYHRYFSHRAYKTNRVMQFLLAWGASMTVQKGVLWWAANHRHHHRFSDKPQDTHSPIQDGFWWSHVGWILSDEYQKTQLDLVPDLTKFPELVWLNRWHLVPAIVYGAAIFALGGWPAFAWGFVLSTVILWHSTFTINSLSHVFGSRRYTTTDTSTNNPWLAALTLGEGWHNNHHAYANSANQGFFWWEYDVTFYVLKAMSWVGLVHDLKKPPLELLEAKRVKIAARAAPAAKSEPSSLRTQTTTRPSPEPPLQAERA